MLSEHGFDSLENSLSTENCTGIATAVGSGICTQIDKVTTKKSGLSTALKAETGAGARVVVIALIGLCIWGLKSLAASEAAVKARYHPQNNDGHDDHDKPSIQLQTTRKNFFPLSCEADLQLSTVRLRFSRAHTNGLNDPYWSD